MTGIKPAALPVAKWIGTAAGVSDDIMIALHLGHGHLWGLGAAAYVSSLVHL